MNEDFCPDIIRWCISECAIECLLVLSTSEQALMHQAHWSFPGEQTQFQKKPASIAVRIAARFGYTLFQSKASQPHTSQPIKINSLNGVPFFEANHLVVSLSHEGMFVAALLAQLQDPMKYCISVGVDCTNPARFQKENFKTNLLNRIATVQEKYWVHTSKDLAWLWAIKEAVSKLLKTGIGKIAWQEMDVYKKTEELSFDVQLHGKAQQIFQTMSLTKITLHTCCYQEFFIVAAVGF